MLKFVIFCSLLLTSVAALANPMNQMMTIKERLRISLWMDGLDEQQPKIKNTQKSQVVLPEEIERALRKL